MGQNGPKPLFPQCKTSIGNNSVHVNWPFFTTHVEAAWYRPIISVVSYTLRRLCMYVYQSDDNLIFREHCRRKLILAHPVYLEEYRSSSYTKVIGSRSKSQSNKGRNPYSRKSQRKTSIVNNYLYHLCPLPGSVWTSLEAHKFSSKQKK